jgi:hypothetical protein
MKPVSSSAARLVAVALAAMAAGCGGSSQENTSAAARIETLEKQLAQLEAAVIESEDVSAVKRLTRTYGYYVEKGLWADLADLFAADAVANYTSGVFVGKASIRRNYVENLGGGKLGLNDGQLSEHMMLQPIVHIDAGGKTARARWRAFAMLGRYAEAATWSEGPYEIEYIKDNGVWKIKVLNYYSTFISPYEDGGWGKKRDAVAPVTRKLPHPADKPRDPKECPQYPGVCVPPFHYKNPVSGRNAGDLS